MSPDTGPLSIRELGVDRHRLARIIDWQIGHYSEAFPSFDHDDWTEFYGAWVHRTIGALPLMFEAVIDGKIVGTVAIVERDDLDDDRSPWIAAMIVDPEARGRGIGSALLATALRRCSECGFDRVFLWTHDQADWYQRIGWTVAENRTFRGVPITIFSHPC